MSAAIIPNRIEVFLPFIRRRYVFRGNRLINGEPKGWVCRGGALLSAVISSKFASKLASKFERV